MKVFPLSLQLLDEMTSVDSEIHSKKSVAQQAEDIKQSTASTADETRETIAAIETKIRQLSSGVQSIDDLKQLEVELQVRAMQC